MRLHTLIIGLTAASLCTALVHAQDNSPSPPPTMPDSAPLALTPDQQIVFDGWSVEQQDQFSKWPGDVQAYYWTLSEPRQELFWKLGDNDRMAITAMDPSERISAWDMVEERMQAIEAPESQPESQ